MEHQEDLTNEKIKKKFKSQFELVGYAIKLAENRIQSGRGSRVKSETENVAINTLEEINAGMDKFEDIPKEIKPQTEVAFVKPTERKELNRMESNTKTAERKRTRKILMD